MVWRGEKGESIVTVMPKEYTFGKKGYRSNASPALQGFHSEL